MTFLFVYLGMTALGLSLEAMITLLTPKFIPFFVFTLVSMLVTTMTRPILNVKQDYIQCGTNTSTARTAKRLLLVRRGLPYHVRFLQITVVPILILPLTE